MPIERGFRLRLFPGGFADFFGFVEKNEGSLFVADDDVREFFVLNIARDDLCADAGVVVDQMRNEIGLPVRVRTSLNQ